MNKRASVVVIAAALIGGCAGSQSPVASTPANIKRSTFAEHRVLGRSWMLPEARGETLIYASEQGVWGNNGVYVYSDPDGNQVGFLQPDTEETYEGLCSDAKGNVFVLGWITNGQSFIDEYPHGGSQPINSLYGGSGVPSSCSVDASTGNLAVANYVDRTAGRGDIAVYLDAQGQPQHYYDSSIANYYYCTYDDKGNLFADGNAGFINELPRKGSTLLHVYFDRKIAPGSLQWNRGNLVVTALGGAKGPVHLDRATVLGSGAQITGTTKLRTYHDEGTYLDVEFWIQGKTVVGPGAGSGGPTRQLYLWPYAAGGKAFTTIRAPNNGNFWGVTSSAAP